MPEQTTGDLFDESIEDSETSGALRGEFVEHRLQLREERLAVNKVRVVSGAVRVRKKVISERRSVDVPVTHEELVVERRHVTGGAPGGTIGGTETITIPLGREEVVVAAVTFVTEEVEIGKRVVTSIERVSETLRREELVVEDDARSEFPARDVRV